MTSSYTEEGTGLKVQAVQFTDKNKDQVYNWARSVQANVYHDHDDQGNPVMKIPMIDKTEMVVSIGDYLILNESSENWNKLLQCNNDVFIKSFTR